MSKKEKPTPAKKADASDELIDAIEDAQHAISRARSIWRRDAEPTDAFGGPFFYGVRIGGRLDKVSDQLWGVRSEVAAHGYEERRRAGKEAACDAVLGETFCEDVHA